MIRNSEILKPINMIGALCMVTAGCSILAFFSTDWLGPEGKIFISVIFAINLLTGIGIVFRTMWGFHLLKFYLYILFIGFPIGTLIARFVLSHIRENDIKQYFGSKTLKI
jgi:hypothetical protein